MLNRTRPSINPWPSLLVPGLQAGTAFTISQPIRSSAPRSAICRLWGTDPKAVLKSGWTALDDTPALPLHPS